MRRLVVAAACLAATAAAAAGGDPKPAPPKLVNAPTAIAVSPDGSLVAAVDLAGALTVLTVESGATRDFHTMNSAHATFTADGRFVVLGPTGTVSGTGWRVAPLTYVDLTADRTVWKATAFTEPSETRGAKTTPPALDPNEVRGVCAEPVGSKIRLLRNDREEAWDLADGTRATVPLARADVRLWAVGGAVVVESDWRGLSILDGVTGKTLRELPKEELLPKDWPQPASADAAGLTTDGTCVVVRASSGDEKAPIQLAGYDVATGKRLWARPVDRAVRREDVVAGDGLVAVVEPARLLFLDAATGAVRDTIAKDVCCVATPRDGRTFWAGTRKGELFVAKKLAPPKAK